MDDQILLKVNNATKYYVDDNGLINKLFENISFEIKRNEFISLVATSGVGKSTLLKVIAGLENLSEGVLEISSTRKIFFIPSDPSSLPGLNVIENIQKVIPDSSININEIIDAVGLTGYEHQMPDDKIFGLKFRISLARALACKPDLILLDEPFKDMSKENKSKVYDLINKIKVEHNISFILSTTNISESIYLSDEIILLNGKPAVFVASLKTNLTKERNQLRKSSSNFIQLRKKIERLLI